MTSRLQHVAIIMDGNGRWATNRGLPRVVGHRKGVEAVKRTGEAAKELGIPYLTLFGFSAENWGRPESEVRELMQLLRLYLRSETAELHRNGVRLRVVGDRSRLGPDIIAMIENAEELTARNQDLNLTVALSYGGRQEIVQASRRLAEDVKTGALSIEDIDESCFAGRLLTADMPDPDLMIRTSGEQRISNFLLWQSAYAEFVFLDTLWPDFGKTDLEYAVREFTRRDRRYGTSIGTR